MQVNGTQLQGINGTQLQGINGAQMQGHHWRKPDNLMTDEAFGELVSILTEVSVPTGIKVLDCLGI